MPRTAYVNGVYKPLSEAVVNVEDRGYQFADGVYEVCVVMDGVYWDMEGHVARFWRSLEALSIRPPLGENALKVIMRKVLRKNRLSDALVYLQATRGVAARNHPFPDAAKPSLIVTARPLNFSAMEKTARAGVRLISQPDIRWGRVDIKSVSLLPNVLAKQAAKAANAVEAMLIKDGVVTEGASSNMWIVDQEGGLVTHPLGTSILGGITRETTIKCARDLQIAVSERPFTLDEAKNAQEVFLTSATNLVTPVVAIDDAKIGSGAPGALSLRLREAYIAHNQKAAHL